MFRSTTLRLGSPIARASLKRNFTSSVKRNGGHHDHPAPSVEEHFVDNPLYLAVIAGIAVGAGLIFFDDSYKSRTGSSFFGKFIHPVSVEQNDKETIAYDEVLQKDRDFYDSVMVVPNRGPFVHLDGVQVIRRGSPFNAEPNSSIDIDSLGPRRQRKSIFD